MTTFWAGVVVGSIVSPFVLALLFLCCALWLAKIRGGSGNG